MLSWPKKGRPSWMLRLFLSDKFCFCGGQCPVGRYVRVWEVAFVHHAANGDYTYLNGICSLFSLTCSASRRFKPTRLDPIA